MSAVIDCEPMLAHRAAVCWSWSTCRRKLLPGIGPGQCIGPDALADNCMSAIGTRANSPIPIAFTRASDGPACWSGRRRRMDCRLEPRRSDMVFERQQPSAYATQLFETWCRSRQLRHRASSRRDLSCATAIDARAAAIASRSWVTPREAARAPRPTRAVHVLATKAIELFGRCRQHQPVAGGDLAATSQRHRMDELSATSLRNVIPVLVEQRNMLVASGVSFAAIWSILRSCNCAVAAARFPKTNCRILQRAERWSGQPRTDGLIVGVRNAGTQVDHPCVLFAARAAPDSSSSRSARRPIF